jgi:hypothetical protein
MDFKEVKDLLNRDVRDIFGPKREGTDPPQEARVQEAHLEIKTRHDRVEFLCPDTHRRFFTLQAALDGHVSISHGTSDERVPTVRVTVPLLVGEQRRQVTVAYRGTELQPDWPLMRATMATDEGHHIVQVVYGLDAQQSQFNIEIPSDLEVGDFEVIEQKGPIFSTPPPVKQMAALLRATLNDRHDAWSILLDLAPAVGDAARQKVQKLRQALGDSFVFLSQPVQWLSEELARHDKRSNLQTLASWCLLVDLESDALADTDVERIASGKQSLSVSWEALSGVAAFYGLQLDNHSWTERFRKAGLPFLDPMLPERAAPALERLREKFNSRDSLTILRNLLRQSPSQKVDEVVKAAAAERLPEPAGLDGLCDLLSASGRSLHRNTVLALCLYVEAEIGRLTAEAVAQGGDMMLSPYTIEAVAGALDVTLLPLVLNEKNRARLDIYEALMKLSPPGMLVALRKPAAGEAHYRFLAPGASLEQLHADGLQPTGDLFLQPPLLDHVNEQDATLFLRLGASFYGCFQSDLDRRRLWRKCVPGSEASGQLHFVEGFRAYHFQNLLVGSLVAGEATTGPAVYRNSRGNLQFHDPAQPPSDNGLTREDLHLEVPTLEHLPTFLAEPSSDRLLGQIEKGQGDVRKLDLLCQVLRNVLAHHDKVKRINDHPNLASSIRKHFDTPRVRQILTPLVDARILEAMLESFTTPGQLEYRLSDSISKFMHRPEVLDMVCVQLIYEMCMSDLVVLKSGFKNFNRNWFRSTLLNQLGQLAEGSDIELRQAGCRLLCHGAYMADKRERLVIEYELNQLLEDRNEELAREAAFALSRLALDEVFHLPRLWEIRKLQAPLTSAGSAAQQAKVLTGLLAELREWLSSQAHVLWGKPLPDSVTAGLNTAHGVAELLLAARLAGPPEGDVIVMPVSALESLARLFIDSWRQFAEKKHTTLDELPADLVDEWREYASGQPRYAALWRPYEQPGAATFSRQHVVEPQPYAIKSVAGDTNPFFASVLRLATSAGPDQCAICSLERDEEDSNGVEALRLLQTSGRRFVSLLHHWSVAGPLDDAEQKALARICAWLGDAEADEAAEETSMDQTEAAALEGAMAPLSTVAASDDSDDLSEKLGATAEVARRFLGAFTLPDKYLNQVLHIFMQARARA